MEEFQAVPVRGQEGQRLDHGRVQDSGALAAAEDEQGEHLAPRLGSDLIKFLPDRIAEHDSLAPEKGQRAGEGDHGLSGEPPQEAVGEPGRGVLLEDERRDEAQPGRQDDRARAVSAHADDQPGTEANDEAEGPDHGPGQEDERFQHAPAASLDPLDGQGDEGRAPAAHDRALHAPAASRVEETQAGPPLFQPVAHGQGGEEVTSRSAAADDDRRGAHGFPP